MVLLNAKITNIDFLSIIAKVLKYRAIISFFNQISTFRALWFYWKGTKTINGRGSYCFLLQKQIM